MEPQASDFDVRLGMIRAASSQFVPPANLPMSTNGVEHRLTPAKLWCEYAGMKNPTIGILAWVLSSEAPDIFTYPQYAYAIGEAVMNAGIKLATYDKRRWVDGFFAHQGGRWCSTWQPPTW